MNVNGPIAPSCFVASSASLIFSGSAAPARSTASAMIFMQSYACAAN